jgi:hypothetical protein
VSRGRRHRSAALGAALAALAVPSPAAAAPQVLTHEASVTTGVAAGGARVVWNRYDKPTRRYRLVVASAAGGPAAPLPIAGGRMPFDPAIGTTAGGSWALVYSRCAHVGARLSNNSGGPARSLGGRDCAVHRYLFAARTDRAIDTHRPRGATDVLARLDRGTLTFFRVPRPLASRARRYTLSSHGRLTSHRAGPAGVRLADCHCFGADETDGPLDLAVGGGVTAYAWDAFIRPRANCASEEPEPLATTIRVARAAAADRVLAETCEDTNPLVAQPSIAIGGGAVWWAVSSSGPVTPWLARYDLRTHRTTYAALSAPTIALAWGDGALVRATGPDLTIERIDPVQLSFGAPPAPFS